MTAARTASKGEVIGLPGWPSWVALDIIVIWTTVIYLGVDLDAWPILLQATIAVATMMVGANAVHFEMLLRRLVELRPTTVPQTDAEEQLSSRIAIFDICQQINSLLLHNIVLVAIVPSLFSLQLLSGVNLVTVGLVGVMAPAMFAVSTRIWDAALTASAAYGKIMPRISDDPPASIHSFTLIMLSLGSLTALNILFFIGSAFM